MMTEIKHKLFKKEVAGEDQNQHLCLFLEDSSWKVSP